MPFKNRVARGWLPGLAFVAVAVVHGVVAWVGGPARNWHGQTSEYYALLTDAFLAGQTSLLVQPAAELLALPNPYDPIANGRFRLHDATLYHGKYYLYFGPTPAIVLFLPYKVLTGSHLPARASRWLCSVPLASPARVPCSFSWRSVRNGIARGGSPRPPCSPSEPRRGLPFW